MNYPSQCKHCCPRRARWQLLGNAEVPHDATDKKDHLSGIVCHHEFGLGGGAGYRGLELTLVCNRATSKLKYSSAK